MSAPSWAGWTTCPINRQGWIFNPCLNGRKGVCGCQTEVIVASIRNPLHVLESALIGADIATIPFGVLKKLASHALTDKGIKAFLDDWNKAQQ